MQITTEKAFDLLPAVAEIIEKLDLKKYITENQTKNEKQLEQKGLDLVLHIIKNTGTIKTEVFEVLAIVQDTTVEEVKSQPASKTIKQFKELLSDKELMSFFKSAVQ